MPTRGLSVTSILVLLGLACATPASADGPGRKFTKDPYSLDHMRADLLKGMEENYAWLGEHWPDSRYVVISLSFDMQGQDEPAPWIEGWRCVYDVKTGTFSVPSSFAEINVKALGTRGDGRN
jgi:hypothetical protein